LAKNNETPPADQSKKPPIEDQLKEKSLKVYIYAHGKKERKKERTGGYQGGAARPPASQAQALQTTTSTS
jgi:hypothetical protein